MKKAIILKKTQVSMETFAPPYFNHFSLNLNKKKRVGMRTMRKKLIIFTLQLPIYTHFLKATFFSTLPFF